MTRIWIHILVLFGRSIIPTTEAYITDRCENISLCPISGTGSPLVPMDSFLTLLGLGSGYALGSLSCPTFKQNTELQQQVNTLQAQVRQLTAANQAIQQQLIADNQAIQQQRTECTTSLSTNQQQLQQCNEQLNACNINIALLNSQLTTCQGELLSFTSIETTFQQCSRNSGASQCRAAGCFWGCYALELNTLYNIPPIS